MKYTLHTLNASIKRLFFGVLCTSMLLYALLLTQFYDGLAYAEVNAPDIIEDAQNARSASAQYFLDFVGIEENNHYDRTAGSEGEKAAAQYILQKFESFSLSFSTYADSDTPGMQTFKFKSFQNTFTHSQNVIGIRKAATETTQQVIIGAHYDNVYAMDTGYGITQSQGVYDNAVSIGVLLALAEQSANWDLPFNVTFIAFGAEEPGLYGSAHYVNQMTQSEVDNTLLMINMDLIMGEHLYLYTDEFKTPYNQYLYQLAEQNDLGFSPLPAIKQTVFLPSRYQDLPYTYPPQNGDNASFYNRGIRTVSITGGNYSCYSKSGFVEYENLPAISHTANDTLETFLEYHANTYVERLDNVFSFVELALQDAEFVAKMQQPISRNLSFLYSSVTIYASLVVLLLAAILTGYLLYRRYAKISKQAPPTTPPPQKPFPGGVFGDEYEN